MRDTLPTVAILELILTHFAFVPPVRVAFLCTPDKISPQDHPTLCIFLLRQL